LPVVPPPAMVLCCICGVLIAEPCHRARCVPCLQKEIDVTEGVSRRSSVLQCGTCKRWLRGGGGNQWVNAELDSRELLGICLKQIKGLGKDKQLVDASFLWTEPHSKEFKVNLSLQQEVLKSIVVQQSMAVDFRINNLQCGDCKKSFTRYPWESSVQVRQRGEHRRTLLKLEHLILQHRGHSRLLKVEATKEGMDSFFRSERDAQAFVAFIKSCAVARHQESKHMIGYNIRNNSMRFKRTTCVELCPVCRDDLVFLPLKVARALGGVPPVMLCRRVVCAIELIDPASGRIVEVSAVDYWKRPFSSACTPARLTEFIVLDVQQCDYVSSLSSSALRGQRGLVMCDVEVSRLSDLGRNDDRIIVRSHLGHILQPGDVALGYDLRTLNMGLQEEDLDKIPLEVYLVRKHGGSKPACQDRRLLTATSGNNKRRGNLDSATNNNLIKCTLPDVDDGSEDAASEDEEELAEWRNAAEEMLDVLEAQTDEEQPNGTKQGARGVAGQLVVPNNPSFVDAADLTGTDGAGLVEEPTSNIARVKASTGHCLLQDSDNLNALTAAKRNSRRRGKR